MKFIIACVYVCFLYYVMGTPDSRRRGEEETIHIEYHSDTYLRFLKYREVPDNRQSLKSSLALQKGKKLREFLEKAYVKDTGHVVNCLNGTKMDLSWTPEVINTGGNVAVSVDAVVPVEVAVAHCKVNVYLEGGKDPIITMPQDVKCEDLKKYSKGVIQCPIKQGFPVKTSMTFSLQKYKEQIPEGNFTVNAQCTNEKNQNLLCIQANIHLVSNDDFRK